MEPCPLNPNGSSVNPHLNSHKFSAPVEMRYKDGGVELPYAVIACEHCGFTQVKKVDKELT